MHAVVMRTQSVELPTDRVLLALGVTILKLCRCCQWKPSLVELMSVWQVSMMKKAWKQVPLQVQLLLWWSWLSRTENPMIFWQSKWHRSNNWCLEEQLSKPHREQKHCSAMTTGSTTVCLSTISVRLICFDKQQISRMWGLLSTLSRSASETCLAIAHVFHCDFLHCPWWWLWRHQSHECFGLKLHPWCKTKWVLW